MRILIITLFGLGIPLFAVTNTQAQGNTFDLQDFNNSSTAGQDLGDPTIPSQAILERATKKRTNPLAKSLFESAKRLHEAGLTSKAQARLEELLALEDAPIEVQDEATVWWSTVTNREQLLDSAKRLHDAGLTIEAKKRVDQLQELTDAPIDIQDAALVWWAQVAPASLRSRQLNRNPVTRPTMTPLPNLPQITLQGIVQSSQETGTAILEVDGKRITILLKPRDQQTRIPVPSSQFLAMRPALEQRAMLNSGSTSTSMVAKQPFRMDEFDMSLESSFVHKGVVYNLEAFGPGTLMLKALPHNELVIVRTGTTP
ncbi:MAG: hypothetical protein AAF939_22005 [Planctomycetota bacterium]